MMTVDDALKLAEDVENHGDKRSSSLSGQALAALAGEVRLLRQDGYRRGMEDMREIAYKVVIESAESNDGIGCAEAVRAIKTEGEL